MSRSEVAHRQAASAGHLSELTGRAVRQAKIVSLLAEHAVSSQAELAALLAAAGIRVTQATLSRDLEDLGAVKLRSPDGGQPCYVVPENGSLAPRRADDAPPQRLARLLAELLASAETTWWCCARRPVRPTSWPAHSTGPA